MDDSEKPENCESRKRSRDEDEDDEKKIEAVEEVSAKRPYNQPSSVNFKVLVPSSSAGAIIGKGGDTINQLQADTATNIKMSKGGDFFPGTTDRVCMVVGSVDNVRRVHSFLLDKVKDKPDGTGSVGEVKTKIVVPNSTASLIIGKSGDNINLMKERTNAFIQVSPKSSNTEKPLSERIISISGDRMSCEQAVDLILEKIVEDPHSSSCPNISYTDGPILPPSTMIASLFATNLTSTIHLPVTGHPTMDAVKFILRTKGYNDAATREVSAAMYTLASYGFIQLRPPVMPTMAAPSQEWPGSSTEALATAASYYAQASEATKNAASAAATNANNQTQDQNNYANYYNGYYGNAGGNYGNGYNAGDGGYDNSYGANANYNNSYGNTGMQSGMQQDMSGYSSGMAQQGNYPPGSGAAYSSPPSGGGGGGGGFNSMNYNMGSGGGGGYQGGMGEFGAQGSGGPPGPPNNNDPSMGRQEVDVAENVLQAIMGAEGKGMMEIQQWCGVTIEVVQKAQFMHTVKIMGPQNSVQSAVYIVQQYVQHAEYKRYYEGQNPQQQGTHQ